MPPAVHPHAGGEIQLVVKGRHLESGPSPRGWGNLLRLLFDLWVNRSIPTRVGKSGCEVRSDQADSVHPHAGGEIISQNSSNSHSCGPSPRGWGNHFQPRCRACASRSIPTRVGKSPRGFLRGAGRAVHPHAGGEIPEPQMSMNVPPGPSPRGWGNPDYSGAIPPTSRSIPTRVGKSCRHQAHPYPRTVHPHAGGEIVFQKEKFALAFGPSPRGWGNPECFLPASRTGRSIPTRVGKSV